MMNNLKVSNIRALLLTLGAQSDLPSYRYSQLDRGVIEAANRLSPKVAADLALSVGVRMKSLIRLLQIAKRQQD